MSSRNLLPQLVRSHFEGDHALFVATATAMASDAEMAGRKHQAADLRKILGEAPISADDVPLPDSIRSMVSVARPTIKLSDMVLDDLMAERLASILVQHERRKDLLSNGLSPRRKLLLSGPPGTGKTMTASALATGLGLRLITVNLDGLVRSYMGETAQNLRQIFDAMAVVPAVWFFDEVDALAGERDSGRDVGEARRILNSLLSMIEKDRSSGLIVAATNLPGSIDRAFFRRFDAFFCYELPGRDAVQRLIEGHLPGMDYSGVEWSDVLDGAAGVGHADLVAALEDLAIERVLSGSRSIDADGLLGAIEIRMRLRDSLLPVPAR